MRKKFNIRAQTFIWENYRWLDEKVGGGGGGGGHPSTLPHTPTEFRRPCTGIYKIMLLYIIYNYDVSQACQYGRAYFICGTLIQNYTLQT